jgi:hypothetical protein
MRPAAGRRAQTLGTAHAAALAANIKAEIEAGTRVSVPNTAQVIPGYCARSAGSSCIMLATTLQLLHLAAHAWLLLHHHAGSAALSDLQQVKHANIPLLMELLLLLLDGYCALWVLTGTVHSPCTSLGTHPQMPPADQSCLHTSEGPVLLHRTAASPASCGLCLAGG